MALNISRGKIVKAQKIVIYGAEGVGKTTLASQFPDPLFIDTEGGTAHYDVARIDPAPVSWPQLVEIVKQVAAEKPCSTLVLDTADWAERLCIAHVCTTKAIKSIEEIGYGGGYTIAAEEYGRLLDRLSTVADSGINVVILAHAAMRKFDQPDERNSYDRWELKLQRKIAPLVKEWADALLFGNYKTIVEGVDAGMGKTKGKARGGSKRVLYTEHHACWDAKNRWGLPKETPLDYSVIAPHVQTLTATPQPVAQPVPQPVIQPTLAPAKSTPATVPAQSQSTHEGYPDYWEKLWPLIEPLEIAPAEIVAWVASKGWFPTDTKPENLPQDLIEQGILGQWEKVRASILDARPVPF